MAILGTRGDLLPLRHAGHSYRRELGLPGPARDRQATRSVHRLPRCRPRPAAPLPRPPDRPTRRSPLQSPHPPRLRRRPVTLPTLATLLQVCFAPVDYVDSDELGAVVRRTSPAGGARQELDAYLAITNVTAIPAGMYHYNSLEHSLELLSKGFTRQDTIDLCAGQDHFGGAAFLVLLVAVIERMRVKYRSPRCYRVSLLGAGHQSRRATACAPAVATACAALTATALGLGPFQTGAFHDAAVVERLGLDNTSRTPVRTRPGTQPRPRRPRRLPLHTPDLTVGLITDVAGGARLHRPAPSGGPSTSRRCRGRLPPSPAFPGSGCPSFTRPLRRPGGAGLSPPLDYVVLRGALR
ncbi:SagB/ThcOx family dehydrogenase [Streptomyces sp. NPDC058304]|uniref:SagB/ThcOx family dehydrogenase n=1 Tax=Streptomyces sp. NPDC058304 TaxID=3346437 RepID=UPI0036EC6468